MGRNTLKELNFAVPLLFVIMLVQHGTNDIVNQLVLAVRNVEREGRDKEDSKNQSEFLRHFLYGIHNTASLPGFRIVELDERRVQRLFI